MSNEELSKTDEGQSRLTVGLGDNRKLRYLLFMGHGHDGYPMCLYGDDGEMQCGVCFCDFVRDMPDDLQRKMERWSMQECIRLGIVKVSPNV